MEKKTRIYCHTCEKEYVITSDENNKKLRKNYNCDYCGSDFIHVEDDRGHSISFKFAEQDTIY